jgi:hypothetical protein
MLEAASRLWGIEVERLKNEGSCGSATRDVQNMPLQVPDKITT